MRVLGIVALCAALGGCAFQRAEVAQKAQASMIGMPKEQVLACMGAPANKAAEGATEVWGYTSGNGMTIASASYDRYGGTSVASSRFCNINIVMASGRVTAVNYTGPTGGLLTVGEQCAYAVDACVKQR
jgi:outer membrane protein assembly factor BamE (lipoprotein component of BamABCDE complex)